jgi:hypothetical protein
MTINFYVHKDDLDQLNKLIKQDTLIDLQDEYAIEVYRNLDSVIRGAAKNIFFLVGISYEDFMRIEDFLRFL